MEITTAHIGLGFGFVSLALAVLNYQRGHYKSSDLADVIGRIIKLETKVDPLWEVLSKEALKGLKSNPDPSHVQRDTLIDKYLSGEQLNRDEARYLVRDFMGINEGKSRGNKGLAVLGIAVLATKYRDYVEDMLRER